MHGLKMPDLTAAQVVGIFSAIIATAVAFGLNLSTGQSAALLGLAGVLAGMFFVSDAAIRDGRAKAAPHLSGFHTPDITKAQIVALVTSVVATAVAFGAPISDAQSSALIGLAAIVAGALLGGDAVIRRGRAKAVVLMAAAQEPGLDVPAAQAPPDGVQVRGLDAPPEGSPRSHQPPDSGQ